MPRLGLNEIYSPSGPLDLSPAAGNPVRITAAGDQIFLVIPTDAENGSADGGNFNFTIEHAAQTYPLGSPNPRKDVVFGISLNRLPGGALADDTKHAISAFRLESFYVAASNEELTELHIGAMTPAEGDDANQEFRQLSFYGNVKGPKYGGGLRADWQTNLTQWLATGAVASEDGGLAAGVAFFHIAEDGVLLEGPLVKIAQLNNNVPLLQQMNAAGSGLVNVAMLNDQDQVELGQPMAVGGVFVPRTLAVGDGSFTASEVVITRADDAGAPTFLSLVNPAGSEAGTGGVIEVFRGATSLGTFGIEQGAFNWGEFVFRTSFGAERLRGHAAGDFEIITDGKALIQSSPDGTRYRLSCPDGGGAATWVAA